MTTRNAEYLRVSMALNDLREIELMTGRMKAGKLYSKFLTVKLKNAIDYLEDRQVAVSPTGSKNRPSPKLTLDK